MSPGHDVLVLPFVYPIEVLNMIPCVAITLCSLGRVIDLSASPCLDAKRRSPEFSLFESQHDLNWTGGSFRML